jgi:putative ABC transport system permease protein
MYAFYENTKHALSTLWANKLRSSLTMLGIIIGIASVVVMISIGKGAQDAVTDRLRTLGTNVLIVLPGQNADLRSVMRGGGSGALSLDDVSVIQNLSGISGVSPEVSTSKQLVFQEKNTRATVLGVLPQYVSLKDMNIVSGTFFTPFDEEERNRVGIIDEELSASLFLNENPLGKDIRIENSIYTIIGVAEGTAGNFFIPLSTAQIRLIGSKDIQRISVFTQTEEEMSLVQSAIETALLHTHKISSLDDADFSVMNQSDMIEAMNEVTGVFTLLLGGIAGISLLVGGIGIMNIILVSVTERTREIGIRKAIGAHRKDILFQFLTESVVLSILGGIIGITLSFLTAFLITSFSSLSVSISTDALLLATSFSFFIGIIFGIIPSYKASTLQTIDALRFE